MATAPSVDCPVCGEQVRIGLPHNVETVDVMTEPDPEKPEDNYHKTRTVSCLAGHDVYVYFVLGGSH